MAGEKRSVFERPETVLAGFIGLSVIVWTLQCSLLQRVLGIDIYETLVWGEQMQWGHSKHPPLSGWLGYFFSRVTGHSDWELYLAAQLCIALGVFFTFKLARLFFDRYRAAIAALLLYFLMYYTPSEMKFCTYLVEIAIAPAASYLLLLALRQKRLACWIGFGAVCGLGFLNKYSFGLFAVAFLLVVLTRREYRRCFGTFGPYLAILTCLLVLSPHLKWLIDHDFVCFGHVGGRLNEKHSVLMPLFVLASALYPVLAESLALALALVPRFSTGEGRFGRWFAAWRDLAGWERCERNREAIHFAGIISLFPGAVYLVLSLAGTDIILMWLCSIASCSGILVMALCHAAAGPRLLKRVSILLALFIVAVLIGTTVDTGFRTSASLHTRPETVVEAAEQFWRRHSDAPIPVVVGGLRFAALVDHYSAGHPPVCEPDDEVMIELYRERIRRHGALLIESRPTEFEDFLKRLNVPVSFEKHRFKYKSLFGPEKKRTFILGYLPPGTKIK